MAEADEAHDVAAVGPPLRVRRQASLEWPEKGTLTKALESETLVRDSCVSSLLGAAPN